MAATRRTWSASRSLRGREAVAGYLFILPWIFGLLIFTAYPILASVFFSLTEYSIVQAPGKI